MTSRPHRSPQRDPLKPPRPVLAPPSTWIDEHEVHKVHEEAAWSASRLSRLIKKACDTASMPRITLADIRRFVAHRYREEGAEAPVVAAQLGFALTKTASSDEEVELEDQREAVLKVGLARALAGED